MEHKFNIKNVYDLSPRDGRKSFYGKAKVLELDNGVKLLQSYSTIVAMIDENGDFKKLWHGWTATTGRHLSAFSGQYNGKEAWTRTPVDHELECIYGDAVVATNYIVSWY
jgi:hypothetical protein